jgi:hypothetical protein
VRIVDDVDERRGILAVDERDPERAGEAGARAWQLGAGEIAAKQPTGVEQFLAELPFAQRRRVGCGIEASGFSSRAAP